MQVVGARLVLPKYKKTDTATSEDDRQTLVKFKGSAADSHALREQGLTSKLLCRVSF